MNYNPKRKILASLLIGSAAGVIDIIPGMIHGVAPQVTLAGFTFWVSISILSAHIVMPVKDWLKGLLVAIASSVPGTILISLVDPNSVIPMIIFTILLGPPVGLLTGKYCKDPCENGNLNRL